MDIKLGKNQFLSYSSISTLNPAESGSFVVAYFLMYFIILELESIHA